MLTSTVCAYSAVGDSPGTWGVVTLPGTATRTTPQLQHQPEPPDTESTNCQPTASTCTSDDFGSNSTYLGTLVALQLTSIKIDRTAAAGLGWSQGSGKLLQSALAVAACQLLTVIAEVFETHQQIDHLLHAGVHLGQGNLWT